MTGGLRDAEIREDRRRVPAEAQMKMEAIYAEQLARAKRTGIIVCATGHGEVDKPFVLWDRARASDLARRLRVNGYEVRIEIGAGVAR